MISSPRARIGVLAGIVIVGIGVALAVTLHSHHGATKQPGTPWYSALAAPYTSSRSSTKTQCGKVIRSGTIGVGHPILPCGAKLELGIDVQPAGDVHTGEQDVSELCCDRRVRLLLRRRLGVQLGP